MERWLQWVGAAVHFQTPNSPQGAEARAEAAMQALLAEEEGTAKPVQAVPPSKAAVKRARKEAAAAAAAAALATASPPSSAGTHVRASLLRAAAATEACGGCSSTSAARAALQPPSDTAAGVSFGASSGQDTRGLDAYSSSPSAAPADRTAAPTPAAPRPLREAAAPDLQPLQLEDRGER